jgi:hypothetical protein
MYSNLQKNVGTITWYGAMAFRENAVPKFLINENGIRQNNALYRGEVYCATVQGRDCDIGQFVISYNGLAVRTGQNFTEPSRIVFNFNYDSQWNTSQGTVVNHDGLLAVELSEEDNAGRTIVLSYKDGSFLIGFVFFLIGVIVWPIWYFQYYRVERITQSVL